MTILTGEGQILPFNHWKKLKEYSAWTLLCRKVLLCIHLQILSWKLLKMIFGKAWIPTSPMLLLKYWEVCKNLTCKIICSKFRWHVLMFKCSLNCYLCDQLCTLIRLGLYVTRFVCIFHMLTLNVTYFRIDAEFGKQTFMVVSNFNDVSICPI